MTSRTWRLAFLPVVAALTLGAAAKSVHQSSLTPAIRVNQVGFLPTAPKLAVVLAARGDRFVVLSADKGDTVFRGELSAAQVWPASAETVRVADFSRLQRPGRYRLAMPDDVTSPTFVIDSTALEAVARASIKAYYYWRASTPILAKYAGPWARPMGHPDRRVLIHPSAASASRPAGTIISSPGGWYDAGDYNKYIINSGITTYTLLAYVEQFPAYVTRLNTGIPESDNAVPDVLDETMWNLQWMRTMQDPTDGGVYNKLTTAAFDGWEPPNADTATRYAAQKSTPAALDFAAVMAHASIVLRPYARSFPGLADSLTRSALAAWRWARAHPDSMYDQRRSNSVYSPPITTGEYGDRRFDDEFRWAAAELYLATKADSFLTVAAQITQNPVSVPAWDWVQPLGLYSLVEHRRGLPRGFDTTMLVRRLTDAADTLVARARASAYRVPIGARADWVWGSNAVAANQGMLLIQAYRATGKQEYLDVANAALDYLLGRNATGYSFVTVFGTKTPRFPHHRPSQSDGIEPPVPGMLVGGPNPGQQDRCAGYPSSLPARSYVDEYCSYASNEVAINWNAPFAYLVGALDAFRARVGVGLAGERR